MTSLRPPRIRKATLPDEWERRLQEVLSARSTPGVVTDYVNYTSGKLSDLDRELSLREHLLWDETLDEVERDLDYYDDRTILYGLSMGL
jgi:hypothetical protein